MKLLYCALALLFLAALVPSHSHAELSAADSALLKTVHSTVGPGQFALGKKAQILVPSGILMIGPADAHKYIDAIHIGFEAHGLLAVAMPTAEDRIWLAFFRYVDGGFVSELAGVDADSILATIKIKNHDRNERLTEQTRSRVDGWQMAPWHDKITHRLSWTVLSTNQRGTHVVHSVRVLGRSGHMIVEMFCRADELEPGTPKFQELLNGLLFTEGSRYGDFREGDKLASFGLTDIITGEDKWFAAQEEHNTALLNGVVAVVSSIVIALWGKRAARRRRDSAKPTSEEAWAP